MGDKSTKGSVALRKFIAKMYLVIICYIRETLAVKRILASLYAELDGAMCSA